MAKKIVTDLNVEGKKVIVRVDFNVPHKGEVITDDTRIQAALPTIKYLLEHNAKVILCSHLGKVDHKDPEKTAADKKKNDMAIVAKRLAEVLPETKVTFVNATRGAELEEAINNMNAGEVVMFQNTRYEDLDGKKESKNNPELGAYWASLGDVFVNDAFGTIHRAHASNVGIATNLPSAFGFLIEKELSALSTLDNPEHPFVVILGGAKVADKIGVIDILVQKADKIMIGGGMAFTFLKAKGYETGKSLIDEENLEFCTNVLNNYSEKIVLPIDVAVTTEFTENEEYKVKEITEIAENEMGLDIGPQTLELFEENLTTAKIVVWNGPLGVYEFNKYKVGTDKLLKYIVDNNIKTILGGGDIVAAAADYKEQVYHASTGGGATLEYLEGKELPGIVVIK